MFFIHAPQCQPESDTNTEQGVYVSLECPHPVGGPFVILCISGDLHVVFAQHSIRSPACGTHDSPSVKQNSSSLIRNIPLPLVDAANDLVDSDIKANVYANIVLRARIVLVEVGQGHPSSTKFR